MHHCRKAEGYLGGCHDEGRNVVCGLLLFQSHYHPFLILCKNNVVNLSVWSLTGFALRQAFFEQSTEDLVG